MARYQDQDGEDKRKVLRDGEKLVVNMTVMDQHRMAAIDYGPGGANRPGHRSMVDHQAARDEAYDLACRTLENAWKSPERAAADTERACDLGRDASMAAGNVQLIRDRAYEASCEALRTAWMKTL